jgi:hypothetical protein
MRPGARRMRPHKGNYCFLCYPCRSQCMFGQQTESRPPRGPEGHHRRLQLEWWALPVLPTAPPRGPAINIFELSGRHSRFYQHYPQGATIDIFCIDSGHSWISGTASQGHVIDVFELSGGRSRFYQQDPLGAPTSTFCDKVVAIPRLLAPPRGPLRCAL